MDVTLEWDANTEPDVDGYKVYYDTDSGHPYHGTEADEGKSGEIEVDKNTTTITLHGLPDGQVYFFVVTAYDTEGLESDYSNEVETSGTQIISAEDSSAGDDGGCFIATAAFGSDMDLHMPILSQFRDKRLANNHLGQTFIALYNKFSPPIADFLRRHPSARAAVRYGLIPISGVAYVALYVHPVILLLGFILLLLTGVYCARPYLDISRDR